MRHALRLAYGAASLATTLCACAAVLGLGDVTYGGRDAAADAQSDTADGSSLPDAATDGPWCSTQAGFVICDDFDHDARPTWSGTFSGAGPFFLDDTAHVSPPRSLAFSVESNANPGSYWSVGLPRGKSKFVLEARIRVQRGGDGGGVVDLLGIRATVPGYREYKCGLIFDGEYELERTATPDDGGRRFQEQHLTRATLENWQLVRLVFDFNAPDASALSLTIGEGLSAVVTTTTLAAAVPMGGIVELGPAYVKDTNGTWKVSFDNVIVRAE